MSSSRPQTNNKCSWTHDFSLRSPCLADSLEQCSCDIKLAEYPGTLFWTVWDCSADEPGTVQNSFHDVNQSASVIKSCDIGKKARGSVPKWHALRFVLLAEECPSSVGDVGQSRTMFSNKCLPLFTDKSSAVGFSLFAKCSWGWRGDTWTAKYCSLLKISMLCLQKAVPWRLWGLGFYCNWKSRYH